MAAAVTLTCAVLAFPIAYYMARVASPRTRAVLVVAVLLPLWASYLIKVYAWRPDPLRGRGRSTGSSARSACRARAHRRHRGLDRLHLPLAAVHDPADLRRPRADPGLAPGGLGRPRRAGRDDLPAGDLAADPAGGRRRLDLHLLADPGRLHRPQRRLERSSSSATSIYDQPGRAATSRSPRPTRMVPLG